MKKDRHPYAALAWAPPEKRGRGRPMGTWRRTIEAEMEEAGKNWNELRWVAQTGLDRGALLTVCTALGAKRIE